MCPTINNPMVLRLKLFERRKHNVTRIVIVQLLPLQFKIMIDATLIDLD